MTALYQLVGQYQQDLAILEDIDIDEQTFIDTLESMRGELDIKATSVAMMVRNLEVSSDAIKVAEQTLSIRRKAIDNRVKRIRAYLLECMQKAEIQKIDSPMLVLSIKKNPPAVEIFDERMVPADYWREPPPPEKIIDKAIIARALKDGFDVPGSRLTQSLRLEIK